MFGILCRSLSIYCHFSLILLDFLDVLFLIRIHLQVDRPVRVCKQPSPDQQPIFDIGCAPEKAAISAART
jgi:hypothetical protein